MSKTSVEQSRSLFGFLKDLLRLRNKPVKTLSTYSTATGHWVHHLDETPATKNGIAFWGSIGLRAIGAMSGDISSVIQLGITTFHETKGSILRLPKITPPEPPEPSAQLGPWIDGDLELIYETPRLHDRIELSNEDDENVLTEMQLADYPAISKEFKDWLGKWEQWASNSKEDLEVRKLYNALFEARDQIRDQSQDWEFVVGIGRLRLGIGTEKEIDRHIFTSPCLIDLDSTTGTIFVRVDDSSSFVIEDDWIQGFKKPELVDLEIVCDVLNEVEDLTDEKIKKELIKLAHKFRPDIVTDIDPVDFKKRESLVLAPSLILRKRGKQDLIKLLEGLEAKFADVDALPAPLRSLLEAGYGEQSSSADWSGDGAVVSIGDSAYLPLALNAKQLKALERADTRNATIIQGPPGTGKTRTIAVMVSHFLAKGQRVLVAAQTPQALREVRSQLPDEIRELAVASLGGSKTDNDDLQKAVNALVAAHENRSELSDGFEKFEKEQLAAIDSLSTERASKIRAIIDIRAQETTTIDVEGLKGSPAHLALVHLEQRTQFSWLSDNSDPEAKAPKFDASDAELIGGSFKRIWQSPIQVSSTTKLPDQDSIWAEENFQRAQKLRALEGKSDENLQITSPYATQLVALLEPAIEFRSKVELSRVSWSEEAISAALGYGDQPFITRARGAIKTLEGLDSLLDQLGLISEIECGETSLDWLPILESLNEHASKKGALKLSVTGGVKKPLLANSLMKSALPILNQVKIMGKSPNAVVDFDRVKAVVNLDHLIRNFLADLGLDTKTLPASRYDRIHWLSEQKKTLLQLLELEQSVTQIKEFLGKKLSRTNPHLHEKLNLEELYQSALAINATEELKTYDRELNAHIAKVRNGVLGLELPYVDEYLRHLVGDDFEEFSRSRSVLEQFVIQLSIVQELVSYIKSVSGNDHKLFTSLVKWVDENPSASEEQSHLQRVRDLVDAFKWKRLGEALGGQELEDYSVLFRAVTRCDDQIEKLVRELARRRSWKKALDRIDATTIVNMNRYAFESKKLGAGTGITAARRKRDIRNYLTSCIPAIPAWIMPIDRVAQFFEPELEMFDVVIVDEASQARLDSIFLLALSKRVVIVGDHKQVSPDGGMLPVAEIEQIVNRHLADDPRKANWSNPDISLFDECKAAFVNMVTLTEHRRCVPEIIGFSNQIAYIPENIRLVPVRQTGSDALPPIRTIFVEDGFVRGGTGQQVNQPEAERVAQEVLRMTQDPEYRGMTIGVVTLQGSKQQELIRNRLIDLIPPTEIEARQIRVGMPPDFQGSERNVILLSMVMAPDARFNSQTKEIMVQRYNVAASRAKDQLVLVHSLRSSDLKNPADLRRQLLDYCQNVEKGLKNPVEGAIGLVPNDERVDPFESLFEQRVHNRIVERGYKVIPQFEPEIDGHAYRIDLVVVGPYGKYAIECDGDFWHGGPEAFAQDLVRQEILQRCGWKFFRIPESRFYGDPDYLDDLWLQLEKFVATESDRAEITQEPIIGEAPQEGISVTTLDPFPTKHEIAARGAESGEEKELHRPRLFPTKAEIEERKRREQEKSRAILETLGEDESESQELETIDGDLKEVDEVDSVNFDFKPDEFVHANVGDSTPREIYVDGLRVREFPKPISREFSWLQVYRSWDPEELGTLTKLSPGTTNKKILDDLQEIIKIEGPILGSFLMRRHYKATGGSSLSSNSEYAYIKQLRSLLNRGEVIIEEQPSGETMASATFRLKDQQSVITRVRGTRDLYDIPPREIAMIIRGVMKSKRALSKAGARESLFRQVLLLLDFTKLTKKAEDHLNRIWATYDKEITAK